ncbi:MAG: ComEC/Rec2 family competence protein, partial [Candidatus Moraniibacteriota bacterium]
MKRWDALLLLCGGFSLGIFLGTFSPASAFDIMAVVGIALVACGFSLFGKSFFIRVIFFLLALALGVWMGSWVLQYWERLPEPSESFRGDVVVVNPSVEKSFFWESEIRRDHCESGFCPGETILLRESSAQERMLGDRLAIDCDMKRPEEYIEIAGRQVAYRLILATRGIGYVCEKPIRVTAIGRSSDMGLRFRRILFSVREKFVQSLEGSLPAPEAALSLGMLMGADEGFSSVERTLFIRTGVTHVTAVSGYNITLVGMLLFFLAIVFGWYRRGASIVAIIGIIIYVLLVGAPASAVRAGIMGSFLLLTLAIGRPGSGFRIWLFALAGMLVWNPLLVRFDIGFELSYLATLALILYASVRERFWMPKNIVARFFFELALISLFVEWLVAPVILIQFGTFSLVSIIANISIVLLVPLIMIFAFLTGLVGLVIPGGVFFLNWPTFFLAHLFIAGAELLSGLPGSFFSDISVSLWWIVLWYVVTGYV